MRFTEFSIRNALIIAAVTMALAFLGLYAYGSMGVGITPNVSFPLVLVTTRLRPILMTTLLTLVFVPAMYTILDDLQELVLGLVGRLAKPRELQPAELAILRPHLHPTHNGVTVHAETPKIV